METVEFKNRRYPAYEAEGNASQFAMPFAQKWCKGKGLDIGCNRPEWAFPNSQMIDLEIEDEWNAYNLPDEKFDYIFSSHCLEHLLDWVGALEYWRSRLKKDGVLFLYLPHYRQKYWKPWHNRKHIHVFTPEVIEDYFYDTEWSDIFVTPGHDLNHSFYAVAKNGSNCKSLG